MQMKEYTNFDAVGLASLVQTGQVKANELVEASIARAEVVNPSLNAIVKERYDGARKEAKERRFHNEAFAGVPLLLKNLSHTIQGEPITAGSALLSHRVAQRDSHFVSRLKRAGFMMTGFTNTPEFGLKNITEPKVYGPTRNPWGEAFSPGGSSGGAAAAVAARIVPVAAASDGGGSIRIPASFTNLVGLKPTRGRIPVGPGVGRQWQGAAIDFVLSRSMRDSARVLDELQVYQKEAAFHTPIYEESFEKQMATAEKHKLRIAWSDRSPVETPVSEDAKRAVRQVVRWLETEGHYIEECGPDIEGKTLMEQYYTMNAGEMAALLSSIERDLGRSVTREDVEVETWLLRHLGDRLSAAHYASSLSAWDQAKARMVRFQDTFDLYITPTTAFSAPRVGELTPTHKEVERLYESVEKSTEQLFETVYEMFLPSLTYSPFTQLANMTGLPAISLPVYKTSEGMPLGVQVITQAGQEHRLLQLGWQLEQSPLWEGG
ncbi:amidase family protein [Geomicrobium sp. JCM 19039]|uniref:amidase family protein n=1 Tax=Geomicrobium sp. JCM 19039 TaxID=1460636 RepID=UPI0005A99089